MPLTRLKSPQAAARWLKEWVTGTLRTDSRLVQPGDAFIAWPGQVTDGRQYVKAALAAGAATCLVEDDAIDGFGFADARIATLPHMKAATGEIADAFFEHPSSVLDVVAVTGTNGKSSTAWWTAQALTLLGRRCGVIGTLGLGVPPTAGQPHGDIAFTGLTTPDPVILQAALRDFANRGFAAAAMEASSIGIAEHRMAGTQVKVAQFTNFTRDHLDYHGTMDDYWQAKRVLFAWPGLQAAVVNIDDPAGVSLVQDLMGDAAGALDVWTYAVGADARLSAQSLRYVDGGLAFELRERGGHGKDAPLVPVRSRLIGDYNASNLLAVIGALRALGIEAADAAAVLPQLTPVPGRMQRVPPSSAAAIEPEVVVDYAHTPDALEKVLGALRPLARARGGALCCVFGCGGNRDASKRPLMGAIAARLADRVVITSDNPRHEEPAQILAQIDAGAGAAAYRVVPVVVEDRAAAIAQAVAGAAAADVIVIAGKGHEDYQEIAGIKRPFSDVHEAGKALRARSSA
jgi:UDP-N-acetylmuramoyl-L-alanyl-D-glutamate--2,6-diaminopimelate ligase